MRNTKLFALALMIIIVCVGAYYFCNILTLFGVAGLIAFILNPLARAIMTRFHLKKGWAITIVFLIFLIFFAIILSTVVPAIVEQIRMFVNNTSDYSKTLDGYYDKIIFEMKRLNVPNNYIDTVRDYLNKLVNYLTNILISMMSLLLTQTTKLLDVLIVITLTVYFMLDTRTIIRRMAELMPERMGTRFLELVHESNDMLWRYLKSKTVIAAGTSLFTFIVFMVLGVNYAMLLAIIAFLMDFIPYFGSIIAGVIAAFVAFMTNGLSQAIAVAVCVLIIQQIQANVISPKIQGDSVGLHPIAVLFALLVCDKIWGPFGMFVAVPLGGLVKLILREVYHFMMSPDPS